MAPNPYAPKTHVPSVVQARGNSTEATAEVETKNTTVEQPEPAQLAEQWAAIPVGSVREVVEWIGDDKDRARAALADERKGVRKHAEEVLSE